MNTKDVIFDLRTKNELSLEQLAEKLSVKPETVALWESGEIVPNMEFMKLLSGIFNVTVNTLLGSPKKLICQCCGMPLGDDSAISHEPDGSFNEDYCRWCYSDGKFAYTSVEELTDFLVERMSNENFPKEQAHEYFSNLLPTLSHWKKK